MKRFLPLLLACAASLPAHATLVTSNVVWPPLSELATQLRSTLPSLPPPDSTVTESEAYVRSLTPWVLPALLPIPPGSPSSSSLLKTNQYPGGSGYLRIGTVNAALPEALLSAVAGLTLAGPLSGLVLDLRFADGTDFGAAIETASALATQGPIEYRLGTQTWRTRRAENPPSIPILILVNRQTRQAAEVLASAARSSSSKSLIVGTNTAGQARAYRPVAMTDTLTLQVAGDPLLLPDSSEFPSSGLKPDLVLTIPEADERAYAVDEYRRVTQGQPMVASGPGRLNEAELVRRRRVPRSPFEDSLSHALPRRRGSVDADAPQSGTIEAAGSVGTVQDPALALALDLIAGYVADTSVPSAPGNSR